MDFNVKKDTRLFFSEIKNSFLYFFTKEDKLHLASFLIIFILSIFLRIYYLNTTLRFDEAFSFTFFNSPLKTLLTNYTHSNNHVLYSILSHISSLIIQNDLIAYRLPSLLAGILFVPTSYYAARILFDKNIALLSMGLIAVHPSFIEFSTNARGYMILVLFFMLIFSLSKFLIKEQNKFAWFLFSLLVALSFYTILSAIYPLLFFSVWLLLSILILDTSLKQRINYILNFLIFLVLGGILTYLIYSPIILNIGFKGLTAYPSEKSYTWISYFEALAETLRETLKQWSLCIPMPILIVLIISIVVSIIFTKKISKFKIPVILCSIPLLLIVVILRYPINFPRFFLFLLPFVLISSSAGLTYIIETISKKNNRLKIITNYFVLYFFVFIITFNILNTNGIDFIDETGKLPDAPELVKFLKPQLKDNELILSRCPSNLILEYYLKQEQIPEKYLSYFSSKKGNVYFIINKTTHQNLDFVNELYGLKLELYKKPKLIKETEFAEILLLEKKEWDCKQLVYIKEIYYENGCGYFIDINNNKNTLEGELKMFSFPINITKNTYYMIEFEIQKTPGSSYPIYFDFYGIGYDNPEQDFKIEPSDIGGESTYYSQIIYSGEINNNTETYFRIMNNYRDSFVIKNLKISEIKNIE